MAGPFLVFSDRIPLASGSSRAVQRPDASQPALSFPCSVGRTMRTEAKKDVGGHDRPGQDGER
jgi:hypothetical protein